MDTKELYSVDYDYDDYLEHYGTPRHSGRYPWGSGENPYQSDRDFIAYVNILKNKGLKETEIAQGLNISTTSLRAKYSIAKDAVRAQDVSMAVRLKNKGMSNTAIGKRMGLNESTVRSLLDERTKARMQITNSTADVLKDAVEKNKYIDVGKGTESQLGISQTKLNTAVALLKEQGYEVKNIYVQQAATKDKTTVKVLVKEGTPIKEIYDNKDAITTPMGYHSSDGGKTYSVMEYPKSLSSSRVSIRYAEDGGKDKDGVIELRRGVEDISLGGSKYAQVRILVDDNLYLKGMAIYSDDLPEGVDVRFNTNKSKTVPFNEVLKPIKSEEVTGLPNNPFGASIKMKDGQITGQRHYINEDGKDQLSVINKVNEEGDWGNWSKTLSAQMLSKQSPSLAKRQLTLAYDDKKEEFESINSLTNPAVKKKLLEAFADNCDSASVHLKAAAMPRQGAYVILPVPELKDNEIYAPRYKDGESVVLIRYPHGGPFEIPELTVNNRSKAGKSTLGNNAIDAVGINPKVAQKLSGADFDGDTVLVIPNTSGSIKTKPSYDGLKDFDPSESYPGYSGMKVMSDHQKGIEMGKVSNLITDMTIQGASDSELERAVKHSMVVIDATKHKLNWRQSEIDNGIDQLRREYQKNPDDPTKYGAASTLISRSKASINVPKRKQGDIVTDEESGKTRVYYTDPNTGKKLYRDTGETYSTYKTLKDGTIKTETHVRTQKSTQMAETDDAMTLSSGTKMEKIYADYANNMKSLANQARKEALNVKPSEMNASAKKEYAAEVASLNAKLEIAKANAPLERKAQILTDVRYKAALEDNPNMTGDEKKKIKNQALAESRAAVGAGKETINISDREWEAMQSGAISYSKQVSIVNNADQDRLKKLATPQTSTGLSNAQISLAKSMIAAGYTLADVAERLGTSTTTLVKYTQN